MSVHYLAEVTAALMTDRDDLELLHEYADHGSHPAFAELVRRYVDLVYSSAARQVTDPHAAEDVTQTVFLLLAQKARRLRPGSVLSAWLLGVTRFAARDHLKRARRRRHYEHAAALERTAEMASAHHAPAPAPPPDTDTAAADDDDLATGQQQQLARVLDDALAHLTAPARDAVVLRFFENQSFRQVGARLGITELAARQRVVRALDRLRALLRRRDVRLGADSLALALAATAVLPAPGSLGTAVAATAGSAAAAAPYAPLVKNTVSLMKVSALKPAVIAALLLVMIAISAAFGARAAGIKWWPGGRDRNSMLAGNPLPAAPPIPIAGGHPKLLAPLADIRPPENYAPPSSGFVTPPARQVSAAAAAGAPAAAPLDGQPITGTIHSPAGTPARGAQVILVISTNDPRGHGGGRAVDSFVIARPDGRFALQPRRPPLGLFVRATEGYVWIPADSIKPDQTITLSRWARLELTVNEGAKPLPRARVTVSPAGDDLQVLVGNNVMMKADDEGRVTLDQVLPGETRLTWAKDEPSKPRPGAGAAWAEGEAPRLPPRETRVKVEPGMTHKVALGGTGRAVTGTIDPADVSEFAYRRGVIRPASPPTKSPVPTPATDSAAAGGTIFFDAHPDGTFTVTDVPPGQYELTIDLGIIVGKNIKIVERYAVARTTFTVPAIAGGANDQPLDIGKVPAAELKVLEIGQPFPKLAGKTPNGEPIAIQDFLERILLVQLGNPSAVRSRGESDWLHALRAHFGHNPMFAMLTLTTSQETRTDPAIGGDGPSPWPVMRLDALPEELESSAARLFLVDADGTLAAKNVTAAQVYAVLDKALDPRPDPRVTFDFVARGPAKANPPFTNIPAPSEADAAAGATVTVIGGVPSWDTPKSNASVLTDGKLPPNEDAPGEAIFFQAGSLEGRFRIDLKDPTDVAEIRTYSWHKDTRAAQVFRVYASDGAAKEFDPAPTIGVDPTTHGWTNIAFVDTRPGMKPVGTQGVAKGGRYVSSISDKQKGTLGTYRHLLFQVFPTEADDVFGHTFYGEIDVIPREK